MAGPEDTKGYMEKFRAMSWDDLAVAAAHKADSEYATAAKVEVTRRAAQAQEEAAKAQRDAARPLKLTAWATIILALATIVLALATIGLAVLTYELVAAQAGTSCNDVVALAALHGSSSEDGRRETLGPTPLRPWLHSTARHTARESETHARPLTTFVKWMGRTRLKSKAGNGTRLPPILSSAVGVEGQVPVLP
jgi:hypothetical protein